MTCPAHDWKDVREPYLVPVFVRGARRGDCRRQDVRCAGCGLEGFRRWWSQVVYICEVL